MLLLVFWRIFAFYATLKSIELNWGDVHQLCDETRGKTSF